MRFLRESLPNALTLSRLAVGLCFPWIPEPYWLAAVLWGAVSDLIDGAVSRSMGATSTVGQMLDPIADKTFAVVVILTLYADGRLELWQLALLGLRDLAVLAGVSWSLARQSVTDLGKMRPRWTGKCATAAQFVWLVSLWTWSDLQWPLFAIAVVMSALAAADYVRAYVSGLAADAVRPESEAGTDV